METKRLLCELRHIITSLVFVLSCETWQKVTLAENIRIVLFVFNCKLSGAAAEPPVPTDSGWAGVSLLSGPGHRDGWNVSHPHQAGPEAFPQACECFCPHWKPFFFFPYLHINSECKGSFICMNWTLCLLNSAFFLHTGAGASFSCHAEL